MNFYYIDISGCNLIKLKEKRIQSIKTLVARLLYPLYKLLNIIEGFETNSTMNFLSKYCGNLLWTVIKHSSLPLTVFCYAGMSDRLHLDESQNKVTVASFGIKALK